METKDIAVVLVEIFGLASLDLRKYNTDSVDLLHALIELESISKVSEYLDISENALEHVLHRKLRRYFPEKDKAEKWSCHLLRMLDLRKCPKCKCVKGFDQYYKCPTRSVVGLSVYCIDCEKLISKKARESNPEAIKAYRKKHYEANRGYYTNKNALRKIFVMQATPPWADLDKIREIYDTCPKGYHVDHKIPLQGEFVCGLHVESNLQHLPAHENISKGNRYNIA